MELPPRTRRIPLRDPTIWIDVGTTSAYAENTVGGCQAWVVWGNYLRVRGEYNSPKRPAADTRELPPRTRRILHTAAPSSISAGTTSAYAENTGHRTAPMWLAWNYLRVRGEYSNSPSRANGMPELPPRTRRIPTLYLGTRNIPGTTSAYAENTHRMHRRILAAWNYLRVRGEYPK